jgi:hypothetical protein
MISTLVLPFQLKADTGYRELTYEDLVQELSEKKSQVEQYNQRAQATKSWMSFGFVTGMAGLNLNGQSSTKYQNGFHVGLAKEMGTANTLFDSHVTYFAPQSNGVERRSLMEVAGKFAYRPRISPQAGLRSGLGMALRNWNISNSSQNLQKNDLTPHFLVYTGMEYFPSQTISLGFDASIRTAIDNSNIDRNGVELALKMNSAF